MNVQLHPDIDSLDKESLCYSIYSQLYHNFFNAQQKKDDDHPYGVEEGDETSIRLKNTAYGVASAIAGAVAGEGAPGDGGLLLEYLKKSGGDMTGALRANYGFEAGVANNRILEICSQDITDADGAVTAVEYGVKITGSLKIGGSSLHIGGQQLLGYDTDRNTATLNASRIDFQDASIHSGGEWIIGNRETGVFISPSRLTVGGHDVYHRGNANLAAVDWTMRDGTVQRHLVVCGNTALSGGLDALYGARLGDKGKCLLSFSGEEVALGGFLSFPDGYGLRIGGMPVLQRTDNDKIQLGGIGSDLLLGSGHTTRIRLLSGISDVDGDCLMLSSYGRACFPGSLTVRHNYGADLLSSYRVDNSDEGIIIHKRLRMGMAGGVFFSGGKENLSLTSMVVYEKEGVRTTVPHTTVLGHRPSISAHAPQNRYSESFHIQTDADFISSGVPVEAAGHVGICASSTRLADKILYLTESLRLQAVSGGIRHYGDSCFLGSVSSEFFSSGFAGSGWAIRKNRTTGNVIATFDEVVARRKLRAYEFEVKKVSATNGSFWISDSCSGDSVEKIS
ncbi:hypothetical protein M103_5082 [Bacteroides fragilis str. 1007-1-F |uniref:hypothetical protein n=1 Tax=Bacteroides fragilis TaxID=817 RepID=UPI000452208F|nr:hypothetical protein [Bacteroides fragilis]EYA22183.1 hypothetical protein M103_5082 [Bacteroides fragilis str. 1007-1-F \